MLSRLASIFSFSERASVDCPWCGNVHDARELCRARQVSRRTFLITASVATAGALLPASPYAVELPPLSAYRPVLFAGDVNAIFKANYLPVIAAQLNGPTLLDFEEPRRVRGRRFVSPWEPR